MKLQATNFNGRDVRVSFEAENEAERHQLVHFLGKLQSANACVLEYDDMWTSRGIGVIVKLKETTVAE